MVVIVADPRLVPGDRARRLDAPDQPGGGQRGQDVIDGLTGDIGQDGADGTENGVGVGMRTGVNRVQNRHPGPGHPQLDGAQLLIGSRSGRHPTILSRFLESVKFQHSVRLGAVPLNTVAVEMVPPNTDRSLPEQLEEARKVARISAETGIGERIGHVMIPGMIAEDDDRPVEMKPKLDVLD